MYIGVKSVRAIENYKLIIIFENNEEKIFDMKEYLNFGLFKELKDKNLFKSAHVSFDTVEWENGADIDPEILYDEGIISSQK